MALEPITRAEQIMSGKSLEPITREERFLAKAAGMDVDTPEPITRREMFLSQISGGGGSGDSGGIDLNNEYGATDGVSYGRHSFRGFDFIKSLKAPYCEVIGENAFCESSIEEVNVGWLLAANIDITINREAFATCEKLRTVTAYHVNSVGESAFAGCANLESVTLSEMTLSNTTQSINFGDSAFRGCSNLTYWCGGITRQSICTKAISNSMFEGCGKLERVDVTDCEYIYSKAFKDCTSLTAVILRGHTVCAAEFDALENTPLLTGQGHIYVYTSMYEYYRAGYEAALNELMPGFFDILFRKIEDYPEICG